MRQEEFVKDVVSRGVLGRTLVCVIGPNGSGKSSIVKSQGLDRLTSLCDNKLFVVLNSDAVARKLKEEDPEKSDEEINQLAFDEVERMKVRAVERGRSIVYDSVGSHESRVEFIASCREQGYQTVTVFVSTKSPEINVARVLNRVE